MERELLHNSIKTPDGTILVSRHGHDFSEHTQEDGRSYFTDGGLDYQRIGFSDEEYTDLSIYTDDTHEKIREGFEWGSNFDKDMNRLPKTIYLKLKDITDNHLNALLEWTKEGYPAKIRNVFINEKDFRDSIGE
jgi:hypothetical protein